MKLFDLSASPIMVNSAGNLSYWIRPGQDNGRYAGVDLHFTDGTWLWNTAATDENGLSLNPANGHGGAIPTNAWTRVSCDLGNWVSGKQIDRVDVRFDRAGAVDGPYSGYIDSIVISGIPDGVYTVAAAGTRADGTNYDYNNVLDTVRHLSNGDGTNVLLGYRLGANSQKWNVHYEGNNLWDLRVIQTNGTVGRALDQGGAGGADGSQCSLQTFSGAGGQQWSIAATNGNYVIYAAQAKSPGVYDVLSGANSSSSVGTLVQLAGLGAGAQQEWMFSPAIAAAYPWEAGLDIPVSKTISLQCVGKQSVGHGG